MGAPSPQKPSVFLFSRSSNQPALIEPLHRGLNVSPDLDYRLISRAEELVPLVAGSARVVLLANCLMKEDIADLYNLLPRLTSRTEDGTLKVLVLNSIRHPRLGSLLRSRASTIEIVETSTSLKALQYKLKNALTAVHQAYQRAAAARAQTEFDSGVDPSLGTKSRAARAKAKAGGHEVLWQSPIEFDRDYWWIPSRKNIRNVVGVWLIDLLGPGPVVGTWEELPGVERSGEKGWVWRPRAIAEDIFQTPSGRWIFFGKQPEFSWQKNLWSFVSKQPMFAFYPDGESAPEYVRIEYRPEEGLLFLENSNVTKSLLVRIQATFESRLGARTNAPEESGDADVGGNFDGWDFKPETGGTGPTRFEPEGDDEGSPDWKDHTGARGADFRAKDLRVATTPATSKPMRNALTPDASVGGHLGLGPVENPGVTSGGEAFERLQVAVVALRKNDVPVAESPEILLYEVNESGSILLLRDLGSRLGDRFVLRFALDTGDFKMECSMDWEVTSIDLALEDGMLLTGTFRDGDFDPLFLMLDRLDARKKELKDFYSAARG